MQEGVPSGIRVEAAGGVGDEDGGARSAQEIQVGFINGMDGFDVVGVVLDARSVEGKLRKDAA